MKDYAHVATVSYKGLMGLFDDQSWKKVAVTK